MKKILYSGAAIAAAGIGAMLLTTASGSPPAHASHLSQTQVTVYGSATTLVTPTTTQITLGVENQAASAQTALSTNNQTMGQVIAALEKLGVPKKAMSTNGLYVSPQYNQANPPAITAYQVSDNLTINTTVALAGKVIDQAVAEGANQVNGINFTAPEGSNNQTAYGDALKNAHSQALSIAQSLGEKVLGARSVVVQTNSGIIPQLAFATAHSAANTPILPGQQQNTVTLKVVYQLGE